MFHVGLALSDRSLSSTPSIIVSQIQSEHRGDGLHDNGLLATSGDMMAMREDVSSDDVLTRRALSQEVARVQGIVHSKYRLWRIPRDTPCLRCRDCRCVRNSINLMSARKVSFGQHIESQEILKAAIEFEMR